MDKNVSFVISKKVDRVINNLKKNNMDGFYVDNEKELIEQLKNLINESSTVAVGGSMTLFETGVIDLLRNGKYNFLDRYKEGLTKEGVKEIYKKSFFSDYYITSSNALLESGHLYNVDGNGNRVAAMLYGPENVIVVVGLNKIVTNLDAAINRTKEIASPANCTRLNMKTPCTETGYCMDCSSKDRICNSYVLIKKQIIPGRIKVVIVGKELGY